MLQQGIDTVDVITSRENEFNNLSKTILSKVYYTTTHFVTSIFIRILFRCSF